MSNPWNYIIKAGFEGAKEAILNQHPELANALGGTQKTEPAPTEPTPPKNRKTAPPANVEQKDDLSIIEVDGADFYELSDLPPGSVFLTQNLAWGFKTAHTNEKAKGPLCYSLDTGEILFDDGWFPVTVQLIKIR